MRNFQTIIGILGLIGLLAIAPGSASQPTSLRTRVDRKTNHIWAGAVLEGQNLTKVIGSFIVPDIKIPEGGDDDTSYVASAWVGIDGDFSCDSGLL